jgi:hypothetical protein
VRTTTAVVFAAVTATLLLAGAATAQDEAATTDGEATAAPPAEPAQPAPVKERMRVLVLDLSDTGGLGPDVVKTVTGVVAVKLSDVKSLDVLSGDDVRRLAELEAERQVAGCDEASCLAELAGALGARYVVFGQLGTLGELIVVNLSLFDSERAEAVGRATAEGRSVERLPGLIGPALRKLLSGVVAEEDLAVLPAEAPPETAQSPAAGAGGGLPIVPIAVASAGGVVLIAGAAAAAFSFVPGMWIGDKEAEFATSTDKATVANEARALRETWYDSGAVTGLLYGGIGGAVVGLGLVGAGIAWAVVGGGE